MIDLGETLQILSEDITSIDQEMPTAILDTLHASLQILSVLYIVSNHRVLIIPVLVFLVLLYRLRKYQIETSEQLSNQSYEGKYIIIKFCKGHRTRIIRKSLSVKKFKKIHAFVFFDVEKFSYERQGSSAYG